MLAFAGGSTATAQKVLLLDATQIASSENVRIVVGEVEKSPANPLFGEEHPWENRYDNLYPNIVWDEQQGRYQCWYSPFLITVEDWMGSTPQRTRWLYRQSGLCYAVSTDGLRWEKPALDILPFNGQPSNLLLRDIHGVGVFKDARDPDPQRRYKLFAVRERFGRRAAVASAFSADGIRWGELRDIPNLTLNADTHNNALWAPTLGKYVAFTRDWDFNNPGEIKAVRLVARTESPDFARWTDAKVVLRGLEDYLQVYAMPVFHHAGVYLGLATIFRTREDRVHVELAWSKDTLTWHRIDAGTPLIGNSPKQGAYDWGCVYPAAVPLIRDQGVTLYFSGSDGVHTGRRRAYLAVASLRPDGFAAAVAADAGKPAKITTAPLKFSPDGDVLVTADVEPEGGIAVALVDANGRAVAHAQVGRGAHTSRRLAWKNPPSGLPSKGTLQFTLTRARLYAFDIRERPSR